MNFQITEGDIHRSGAEVYQMSLRRLCVLCAATANIPISGNFTAYSVLYRG
jgi:hypothetical protein